MPKSSKRPALSGRKPVANPLRTPIRPTQGGWQNLQVKQGGKSGKPPRFPGRTGGR